MHWLRHVAALDRPGRQSPEARCMDCDERKVGEGAKGMPGMEKKTPRQFATHQDNQQQIHNL